MSKQVPPSLLLTVMLAACGSGEENRETFDMGYSDFLTHVKNGNVDKIFLEKTSYWSETIIWQTDQLHCDDLVNETDKCAEDRKIINGAYEYQISVPANENVFERVADNDVKITATPPYRSS